MSRVAEDRLIKITNLNLDLPLRAGDRTEITYVAVPANPHWRAFRNHTRRSRGFQPFVKLDRIASYVSMGRRGHLETAAMQQRFGPASWLYALPQRVCTS